MLKKKSDYFSGWPAALWVAALLAIIAMGVSIWNFVPLGDTRLYNSYAHNIWHGALPYRGQPLEYPPGVLPFILLAYPLGLIAGMYAVGFLVLTILAVGILFRDRLKLAGWKEVALLCLLFLPMLMFVYLLLDIFAVLALYGAFRYLQAKRFDMAALLLGASALVKVYPLVCFPAFLLALPANYRRRFVIVTAATIAVGLVPFLLFAPSGIWHAVTYHTGRGIQIESGPAAVGFILHIFGSPISFVRSHESRDLIFPGAHWAGIISSILLAAGFAALWRYLAVQRQKRVVLSAIALLLFFILTFKVGSPQYLLGVFVLSFLAKNELPKNLWNKLYIRLLLISSIVGLIYFVAFRRIYPNLVWDGDIFLVLRTLLELELFIWILRLIKRPLPKNKLV